MQGLVWNGSDGICFVHYLGMADTPREQIWALRIHKELIEDQLKKRTSLDSVAAKYNWLVGYHNDVVTRLADVIFADLGLERNSLMINTRKIGAWGEITSDFPID